ncbi:hypothetical protein ACF0H5_021574 [Mactra antiquata]
MLSYLVYGFLLVASVSCDEGQKAVDLFHAADTNNDDQLTRAELDEIFLMFDRNNDSSVTPDEFVDDWMNVFHLGGLTEAQTLFTRADTNDDGYINIQDIPAIFAYFDEDGNGYVDISEFLTQWGDLSLHPIGSVDVSVVTG